LLSEEKNRLLTQVGPGTPMGALLRRYWMPIAAVSEFETRKVKPVRLMGEDLVLYEDGTGRFGLIDRHCPHRRADLSYGFTEDCGLRCNYHGWLFDGEGRCLEQPFDDTAHAQANFKDKVRIKAYPVEAKAGLLWAYLGPAPAPLVPTWEPFTWKNGFVQIVFSHVPCNWVQCQENSIDPVHFEWMHRNWTVRLKGALGPYGKKHVKIDFERFAYGFVYKRLVEGMPESHPRWVTGRICLWPNCLGPLRHFEWRVPIDDENTLSVVWHFSRVPTDRAEPYTQTSIPSWEGPLKDPLTGRWLTSHVMNQDFVAWLGQGTIADRSKEHLAASDRGVTLMRKQLFDDLDALGRGEDPFAVVRDPSINDCISLPIVDREIYTDGLTLAELRADPSLDPLAGYGLQAGQPEDVRRAFFEAMGVDEEPAADLGADFLIAVGASNSKRIWS
jgi:5,5'-dehydrodivanillate O-demethylase oxygenase subunit